MTFLLYEKLDGGLLRYGRGIFFEYLFLLKSPEFVLLGIPPGEALRVPTKDVADRLGALRPCGRRVTKA